MKTDYLLTDSLLVILCTVFCTFFLFTSNILQTFVKFYSRENFLYFCTVRNGKRGMALNYVLSSIFPRIRKLYCYFYVALNVKEFYFFKCIFYLVHRNFIGVCHWFFIPVNILKTISVIYIFPFPFSLWQIFMFWETMFISKLRIFFVTQILSFLKSYYNYITI